MKKQDDTSKKLIKNVVSLVTSALVLAAATFAWFGSNTGATVNPMKTKFDPSFTVTYSSAELNPDDVLWDFDAQGSLYIRTADAEDVSLTDYLDDLEENATWVATDGSSVKNEVLYPGEFRVYRLDFTSVNTHSHVLQIQSDASLLTNPLVTDTIFVGGYIKSAKDGMSTGSETASKSLTEALSGGSQGRAEIVAKTISSGDVGTAYYLVGIPGTDINNTHDLIRESGATVNFTSIEIV